jgi:hypothetical protein
LRASVQAVPTRDGEAARSVLEQYHAQDAGDEALLTLARSAAAEHQDQHSQPITRDALRAASASPTGAPPNCAASSPVMTSGTRVTWPGTCSRWAAC